MRDFVINLIGELLTDKTLDLTEEHIRFYDRGTTAEADEALDSHIRWDNARYFHEDSNVIRSSILIVQFPFEMGSEYVNFHIGALYRIYRNDGMNRILAIIKDDIDAIKSTAAQNVALMNQFGDYRAVKERLIIRPLNYDNNNKALSKGIIQQIGDIALVLYISLNGIEQDSSRNLLSAMVLKDMFQNWNVDKKELFDWALKNTMRLQPPVFCQIINVNSGLALRHVRFMNDESIRIDFNNPLAPALSTEQEINGAIAAFYPDVLERLYQMIGGDFYLVFTSIYDVHIYPVDGIFAVRSMRSSLEDMNKYMNRQDELLSRQIYRYSGNKKELTVI